MQAGASFNIGDLKAKIEQAIAASKTKGDYAAYGGGRASPATTGLPRACEAAIDIGRPAICRCRSTPASFTFRYNIREPNMRTFLVFASVVAAFVATMTVETTDANAVVCAAGVYRAGCAGPRGAAVVVRRPVAACHYVVVKGARVRRCV
jgi:hypothetical protein